VEELLAQLAVFVIAAFLGFELISRVPNLLHTPLMSATNAIHGVILVGGMITLASDANVWIKGVGFLAVFFGALNVVGGFWVTNRMLGMFRPPIKRVKKRNAREQGEG
jgi:H+-translocating NAD(P) transhydrogenase subunit alpha